MEGFFRFCGTEVLLGLMGWGRVLLQGIEWRLTEEERVVVEGPCWTVGLT